MEYLVKLGKMIWKNKRLLVIFFFSFCSMSLFFAFIDGDVLWNYGFSYAISRGEIPYLDFNMVITPFYPMLMGMFLKIFSHNILVFYLVNSFFITFMFYLLFDMFDYKAWIFFIFLFFPLPAVVFPTYNLFLIFLFVLLLYLEKNHTNDYLIGILLGLLILTKQTVGIFLCLPSFYYLFKNNRKILRRVVGCFFPCFIFLIYLIINKNFMEFFDLCLFGMFDFTKDNGKVFTVFFFLTLVMVIFIIYRIVKDRKNIIHYYVLSFSIITFPLFDINHFEFFLFTFLLLFIEKVNFRRKELCYCSIIFSVVYVSLFFSFAVDGNITYPNHYHNFESRFLYNGNGEFEIRDRLNEYIQENKDKEFIFLSSEAYFYKITNEMDITYFDLLNKGNHGYRGTEKLIRRIQQMDGEVYFIVSYDEYEKVDPYHRQQINKEVMEYVIEHGEMVNSIECFRVYKLSNK